MNIQKVFDAVKEERGQHSLVTMALELEDQGYTVLLNNKLNGSNEIIAAEEQGLFHNLPMTNGAVFSITSNSYQQSFRIHFLDDDRFCLSDIDCSPVILDDNYTMKYFQDGRIN